MSNNAKNLDMVAILEELKKMSAELELMKAQACLPKGKKNQVRGKAAAGRTYTLLADRLSGSWKTPQQQSDLAAILVKRMDTGVQYTEEEVFDWIVNDSVSYPSLANSRQDATYLFRYYRGLKNSTTHCGFIGRGFIRMKEGA